MSIIERDPEPGGGAAALALLARAAAADVRGDRRLDTAIDDFCLGEDGRLNDRERATLALTLEALIGTIEATIRAHAARLLAARALHDLAAAIDEGAPIAFDRLTAAGLTRDPIVMRDLIGRVRQGLMSEALPREPGDEAEAPSLLARLSRDADHVVARGAIALLAAENRRRSPMIDGPLTRADLPAVVHDQLVWWIAAALRETAGSGDIQALDRALAESARRSIAAHDENDRVEAVATQLVIALDARADECAALLGAALGDQRLSLFIALIAHALGADYADIRDLVLDPDGERLWLVLRALELDRGAIARIGLALCEADRRRDIEHFAATLDTIVAIMPERARAAIAPILLPQSYRAATLAVTRGVRR